MIENSKSFLSEAFIFIKKSVKKNDTFLTITSKLKVKMTYFKALTVCF